MIELRAYRYRLPMRPIQLAGHTHAVREGLVLCDAATQQHWGEAAPLPWFSRESLQDVMDAWRSGNDFSLPSLRSAVDSIQHSIACTERSEPADPADPADPGMRVPVNGLLSGSGQEVIAGARLFAERRHRAVKLKVGPGLGSIRQCAEVVRSVRAALRPVQALRLDANRAWNLYDAIQFGKLLADVEIEYCEEPLEAPKELETFLAETGMPYALDETLRQDDDLSRYGHARAFVVKPMLDGSREDIQRLRRFGVPFVLSGTFETGIGTMHVARLAHELSPGTPAGVDSYSWLQQDLIVPRLVLDDGMLTMRPVGPIQYSLLQELLR